METRRAQRTPQRCTRRPRDLFTAGLLLALTLLILALLTSACGAADDPAPPALANQPTPPTVSAPPARPTDLSVAAPTLAAGIPEPVRPLPPPRPSLDTETATTPRLTTAQRRAVEIERLLADAGVTKAAAGQRTVVIDPGHGGGDPGAALNGVAEPSSNLDFALRVEEILLANGFHVILTRRDDGPSILTPASLARGSAPALGRRDREARVELAAFLEADAFISIHSNGHPDPEVRGVEAWYHPTPLLAEQNRWLGILILSRVQAELLAYGYEAASLGVKDDTCWRQFGSICRSIYVLSPPLTLQRSVLEAEGVDPLAAGFRDGQNFLSTRGTRMPSVLVELLFVGNEEDAAVLRDFLGRQAIARGVAQGVIQFFADHEPPAASG